jgi:hypothetical protein
MESYTELVDHLAHQIRDYPRGGGQDPRGMKLLRRDPQGRKVEEWPKDSTIPSDVAKILLGIKFNKRKAVASCFLAAEEVARNLGLNLSWEEDYALGAYLLSCLVKAGYYRLFNILRSKYKKEYALEVAKKAVQELAEYDPCTSFKPFSPWKQGIDEAGHRLVTPSFPQLKKTVWVPDEREFRKKKKRGEKDIEMSKEMLSAMSGKVGDFVIGSQLQGQAVVWQSDGSVKIKPELDISVWVKAVNKLETNAYRINQRLLNAVLANEKIWLTPTDETLEAEFESLKKRLVRRRSGAIWDTLSKENRTYEYLAELVSKQKEQDKARRDQELEPHPDGHKQRYVSDDQWDAHKAFWRKWYENQTARQAVEENYEDFIRVKGRAEDIGDRSFYQRAFVDYRGRLYLNKSIVHYQGGDFSRAIIEFADGKKLRKADRQYLWIHLANTRGIKGDQVTKEIVARNQAKEFIKWGSDPVKTFKEWSNKADDPWQCIRACIELVELEKNPNYKSTLIAEIDQSTSCLQHVALLSGNEALADRVNLGDEYNDIYQEIGDSMRELLDEGVTEQHRRKIIKTALVPWTYGGNAFTACQEYHKSNIPFLKGMDSSARLSFAHRVIKHIKKELKGAVDFNSHVEALLQHRFDNTRERNAIWGTPSQFSVYCYKQQTTEKREYVWNGKGKGRPDTPKLTAWKPMRAVKINKIKTAFAPNFVHSVDASVMHFLLANAPKDQNYVTIHDAIGTHLRDIDEARKQFAHWFYTIYSRFHPYLMAFEGVHEAIAEPREAFVSKQLLQKVKNPLHMMG